MNYQIGVHTFQLCTQLKYCQECEIRNYLYDLCKGKNCCYKSRNDKFIETKCSIYSNYGIVFYIRTYYNVCANYKPIYFYIRVNPAKLLELENSNIVCTSLSCENIHSIEERLESVIEMIPSITDGINGFHLHRFDLCLDFYFPDEKFPAYYVKLLDRCLQDKDRQFGIYDTVGKRVNPPQNSVQVNYDSFSVAVYDKQAQILDNMDYYTKTDVQASKGILRYELRFRGEKLWKILGKGCNNFSDKLRTLDKKSLTMFQNYAYSSFGSANFITMNELKNRILQARLASKTKERMLRLIINGNQYREIEKAIASLQNEFKLSSRQCDNLLLTFENLGFQPICIPEKWISKKANLSGLFNLVKSISQ